MSAGLAVAFFIERGASAAPINVNSVKGEKADDNTQPPEWREHIDALGCHHPWQRGKE
jgi:hypothetical protein